ncbi:MAG: hypothetical protein LQ341_005077 [Variospora aurantia]|nr:MAG: hypothetical protein LQ341_005077 [Variospora aurantia]
MPASGKDIDFPPALQQACTTGDLNLAKSLYTSLIKSEPLPRLSLLTQMAITSARNGHSKILSFCFASGLKERPFNCNDDILYAACSTVCEAASIPVFAVLLDEGGLDVNHYLELLYGDILNAAVEHGNIQLVKYLFARGADPNSDRCALHADNIGVIAAIVDDRNKHSTEMLRVLFEHGATIEETGALIRAAEVGNVEAVKLIFEIKGDEVVLEEETEEGLVDRRMRNDDGTALYKAAAGGHAEIVDILIRKGANIGFEDPLGRSVIKIARNSGHQALASRLEQLMSIFPPS